MEVPFNSQNRSIQQKIINWVSNKKYQIPHSHTGKKILTLKTLKSKNNSFYLFKPSIFFIGDNAHGAEKEHYG